MPTVVFAQAHDARVEPAKVVTHARSYFLHLLVDILEERGVEPDGAVASSTTLRLELTAAEYVARFRIESRAATDDDRARARRAEERGRAGGMAELAARCGFVWHIELEAGPGDALGALAVHDLSALLSTIALGPVMPAEGDTLFGVRGARERADRIRKEERARREHVSTQKA
ncbi:MAG: hypothetical protein OZ921_03020 [Sorangiineae bacterium]|nr:hypothetical protein [Sorangiineae bacterium]